MKDAKIYTRIKILEDIDRIQVGQRSLVTLPKHLRDRYPTREGNQMTLIDLGGVFVLSTDRVEVDYLADQIQKELAIRSSSLDDCDSFPFGTPGDGIEWLRKMFSDYGSISSS